MFDFLITCRICSNLNLLSVQIFRLYFVEKIPALATQKRVNKTIPQSLIKYASTSPIKYAREVKFFYQWFFN